MRTRRWAFLMCLFVDYIHYDVGGMLASANYMSCICILTVVIVMLSHKAVANQAYAN